MRVVLSGVSAVFVQRRRGREPERCLLLASRRTMPWPGRAVLVDALEAPPADGSAAMPSTTQGAPTVPIDVPTKAFSLALYGTPRSHRRHPASASRPGLKCRVVQSRPHGNCCRSRPPRCRSVNWWRGCRSYSQKFPLFCPSPSGSNHCQADPPYPRCSDCCRSCRHRCRRTRRCRVDRCIVRARHRPRSRRSSRAHTRMSNQSQHRGEDEQPISLTGSSLLHCNKFEGKGSRVNWLLSSILEPSQSPSSRATRRRR